MARSTQTTSRKLFLVTLAVSAASVIAACRSDSTTSPKAPSEPTDSQPDEYEVALAAHRMEERTIVKIDRIHSRWAGLRTFAPDRHPVVGFAPNAQGFFWLAGQGGFGLQTSPALARIAAALITGGAWPIADVTEAELSPARFVGQAA